MNAALPRAQKPSLHFLSMYIVDFVRISSPDIEVYALRSLNDISFE